MSFKVSKGFFHNIKRLSALVISLALIFSGCTRDGEKSKLVFIKVSPSSFSLPLGKTARFSALGIFSDKTSRDITALVSWSSSSHEIAEIINDSKSSGIVKGIKKGSASIIATEPDKGISAMATILVKPPVIDSIAVIPEKLSSHPGQVHKFQAIGNFSDGTRKDITETAEWSSLGGPFPFVSNVKGSKGLTITPPKGSVTITAMAPVTKIKGTAVISATSARLNSIAITPPAVSIPLGSIQKFKAMGEYEDGTQADITADLIWTTSNPSVASAKEKISEKGKIQSVSMGSVMVKATDPGLIITDTAHLKVTAPRLVSISIQPSSPTLFPGNVKPIRATGVYSNGQQKNITGSCRWKVSDPSLAILKKASGGKAVLCPKKLGTGFVKVKDPNTGMEASTPISVTTPILASLSIKSNSNWAFLGRSIDLCAMGTFTDTKTSQYKGPLDWTSSNTSIAKIIMDHNTTKIQALAPGRTFIIAMDKKTGISDKIEFESRAPVLLSIKLSPLNPSRPVGMIEEFTAMGSFSDDSEKDITSEVQWTASNPSVAKFINNKGNKCLLQAASTGETTVSAKGPKSHVKSATTFKITPPALISIKINPDAVRVNLGQAFRFKALGRFSDGKTRDMTQDLDWLSSDKSVARMESPGLVTPLSIGPTIIYAKENSTGESAKASLMVRATW